MLILFILDVQIFLLKQLCDGMDGLNIHILVEGRFISNFGYEGVQDNSGVQFCDIVHGFREPATGHGR